MTLYSIFTLTISARFTYINYIKFTYKEIDRIGAPYTTNLNFHERLLALIPSVH